MNSREAATPEPNKKLKNTIYMHSFFKIQVLKMDSREAATPEPNKKLIYNNIYNIPIGGLLISQQHKMYR